MARKKKQPKELSKWVDVYRKSTKTKVPYPVLRSHLRFNPDLRVVPSDPSAGARLQLSDPPDSPHQGASTPPPTGDVQNTTGPTSGSESERK